MFLESHQPTDVWGKQMGQLHAAELKSSFRSRQTSKPKTEVGGLRQSSEFAHSWTKHSSETLRCLLIHLDGWDHFSVIPQNSLFYTPTDSAYNLPWTKFPLLGPPARCVLALGHSLCLYQTICVSLEHSPGTSLKLSEEGLFLKAQECHTKSHLSSRQLSGAWGTHIAWHRILVSWENLSPECEHEK